MRDDKTYYRDDPHLAYDSTFMDMIMRATYDTYWAGNPLDLCEFGAPQETGLFFSKVSKLQDLSAYIVMSEDGKFIWAGWQQQDGLVGTGFIHSIWFSSVGFIKGTIDWIKWILTVINMAQQQLVGIGSGGLPNWPWDPRIHLVGSLLHLLMVRVVPVSDLLHFWIVMRGLVDIHSIWRDMFSLLILGIESGDGFADFSSTGLPL